MKPLCIDLFCGLGGWAEGFLAEGYDVIGFDIERRLYPGQLVLQDVLTLHGRQFKDVAVIVASSPCQFFSRMAMPFRCPWNQAEFEKRRDLGLALFHACARIQREASEAAGHHIPMVQENVCGAQKWVGRARWHYGSFYLWGDVPALMPFGTIKKLNGADTHLWEKTGKHCGNWSTLAARAAGIKQQLSGPEWFDKGLAGLSSKGFSRKQASAEIAKIPFPLAQHIARVFKP
jgi:C-5 cytosine-specific DNA methylase